MSVDPTQRRTDEGSGSLDSFEDVITQACTQLITVDLDNVPDDPGTYNFAEQTPYEPVGENFWNEVPANKQVVAELVAVEHVDSILQYNGSTGDSTIGEAHYDANFGIQPGREGNVVNIQDNLKQDPDNDSNDEITMNGQNFHNHRYLFETYLSANQGTADSSSGVGAGGYSKGAPAGRIIPLRQMFGRGPLLDDEEVLTWNGSLRLYGPTSEEIRIINRAHCYWDIYQRDLGDFEDVLAGR